MINVLFAKPKILISIRRRSEFMKENTEAVKLFFKRKKHILSSVVIFFSFSVFFYVFLFLFFFLFLFLFLFLLLLLLFFYFFFFLSWIDFLPCVFVFLSIHYSSCSLFSLFIIVFFFFFLLLFAAVLLLLLVFLFSFSFMLLFL